eukprot:453223_1
MSSLCTNCLKIILSSRYTTCNLCHTRYCSTRCKLNNLKPHKKICEHSKSNHPSFNELQNIHSPTKNVLFGYFRNIEKLFQSIEHYYKTPEEIIYICLSYCYHRFTPHMTIDEACNLKVEDEIDFMMQNGKFILCKVTGKKGNKIIFDKKSVDCTKEIHKLAKAHSISKRRAQCLTLRQVKVGDQVDINPVYSSHPGWKSGIIVGRDGLSSGQVNVSYGVWNNNQKSTCYYWVHLDNTHQVMRHGAKKYNYPLRIRVVIMLNSSQSSDKKYDCNIWKTGHSHYKKRKYSLKSCDIEIYDQYQQTYWDNVSFVPTISKYQINNIKYGDSNSDWSSVSCSPGLCTRNCDSNCRECQNRRIEWAKRQEKNRKKKKKNMKNKQKHKLLEHIEVPIYVKLSDKECNKFSKKMKIKRIPDSDTCLLYYIAQCCFQYRLENIQCKYFDVTSMISVIAFNGGFGWNINMKSNKQKSKDELVGYKSIVTHR